MPQYISQWAKRRWHTVSKQTIIDRDLVYLSGYESDRLENRSPATGTVTATGAGAQRSVLEKKFGTASLDIINSELQLAPGDMPLAGDWTLEGWMYPTTLSSLAFRAMAGNFSTANGGWSFWVTLSTDPRLQINMGGGFFLNSTSVVQLNQWQHFAATRKDNTIRLWYNGNYEGSLAYSGTPSATNRTFIGNNANGNVRWDGYLDELRFVDGYAVYTDSSDITLPTGPY